MRNMIIAMMALTTAACGGTGAPANQQTANRQHANQVAPQASGARIADLPEAQRNVAFYRAIYDAGHHCGEVTGSTPAAPYRGMPVWTVTCRGGGHWTLVIGANETVQILNADEAQLVRGQPGNGQ